jgi:hypothetical protein
MEFELTKRRWNYSSTGRKMVQNLPHSYPVIHLSQRKMYSVVVKIQWNRVRQFGFHDFIKIIESTRTQIRQANWRFELADAADYDDTIMSLKARRKQDKLISNHKKKEKNETGRREERWRGLHKDRLISWFPFLILLIHFLSYFEVERHGIEVELIEQLTLTGNQPIQSVGLLTRITCWVELIWFFLVLFALDFLCCVQREFYFTRTQKGSLMVP